nr:protein ALP1-like [Onthophagus taurus]
MIMLNDEKKKKKRVWTKEWLRNRERFTHLRLLKSIQASEPPDFINYLRMDYPTFAQLLSEITPLIERKDTLMRDAVTPEERLIATLRFLATGRSFEDLKFSYVISTQLLGRIIPETCRAIYKVLRKKYLKFPSKDEEWIKIAMDFKKMWQFEICLGSMDGKHIAIKQPPGSGSYFYNYKGFYSTVLFANVNANYEFIYVYSGTNGRISGGGVIKNTEFYNLLMSNSLKIPQPVNIPGISDKLPYVFIGDEAFPLMTNLMKPYSQSNTTGYEERVFNYRVSRARRVVENAFGIMSNRFRILLQPIATKVETVDDIVLACCVLHNFLRTKSSSYIQSSNVDRDDITTGNMYQGDWRYYTGELVSEKISSCVMTFFIKSCLKNVFPDSRKNEMEIHW